MKKLGLFIVSACATAILSGCASGIVAMGEDTYYMSDTGLWSWSSKAGIKANLIKEATAFCAKEGKKLQPIGSEGVDGSFNNFAQADFTFRCLAPNDAEYHRPGLKYTPLSGHTHD